MERKSLSRREGKGKGKGKGRGRGRERKGKEGKERKGKAREGKGREGKGSEAKGREEKRREDTVNRSWQPLRCLDLLSIRPFATVLSLVIVQKVHHAGLFFLAARVPLCTSGETE